MQQREAARETTEEGRKRAHRRFNDAVLALSRAFALDRCDKHNCPVMSNTNHGLRQLQDALDAVRPERVSMSVPEIDGYVAAA